MAANTCNEVCAYAYCLQADGGTIMAGVVKGILGMPMVIVT